MNFTGGTTEAVRLFEALASESLLCMPYTDSWMKMNAKRLGEDYKQYRKWIDRNPDDRGIVLIDASSFYGERIRDLIRVLPAFGTVFQQDNTMTNPDFIVLNLKTQKMILFGLGRKDQVYARIYVDGQLKYVSAETYNNYINQHFERVDDDSDDAADLTYRYLQGLCGDWFEIIDSIFNSLEAFGIANFEYMSLPGSRDEVALLLDEKPTADGVYELGGEELSEYDLRRLLGDYKRLEAECSKNLAYLKVLFPKVDQSVLATGAY